MNEQETNEIQIPIKSIVEQSMTSNGANYQEDEFNLLRKYFIACLNLGFMQPKDLVLMVNKFSKTIKYIHLAYNGINKMDHYIINGSVLYIDERLKEENKMLYELNFYKAVTEVVFNANDKHIGISNALTFMAAEKIYNMDTNESRIIMPSVKNEQIGNKTIQVRAGYSNYNLIISLVKQLFFCKELNELSILKDMYFNGFDDTINQVFTDDNSKLLIDVLDKLTIMYIKRIVMHQTDSNELVLLEKYQIIINDMFTNINQNYFAFCALITDNELREKCMKKLENK